MAAVTRRLWLIADRQVGMVHRVSVYIEACVRILVVLIFTFMLGTVLLEVAARNFAFRVRGLDELGRYSLIWFVFLITGVGARYGELIGAEVLVNSLPRRFRVVIWLLARLLMLVFLGLLAYYAWQLLEFLVRTRQNTANLGFPLWWAYLPIFLGTALMFGSLFVDLLIRLWRSRQGQDLLVSPDEKEAAAPWN